MEIDCSVETRTHFQLNNKHGIPHALTNHLESSEEMREACDFVLWSCPFNRHARRCIMGLLLLALSLSESFPLVPVTKRISVKSKRCYNGFLQATPGEEDNEGIAGMVSLAEYSTSDASSKGLVSSLTKLVNFLSGKRKDKEIADIQKQVGTPPKTGTELMERIRVDYADRNYLWTGDVDLACFDEDCRFTDPTISFVGRDKFQSNTQNLKVIVDALTTRSTTTPDEYQPCRSNLLNINVTDEYVQTRWNMIGTLTSLPWKPTIDVVGQTKFWYKPVDSLRENVTTDSSSVEDSGLQVYFYDESWEIPAGKALLQLVTPTMNT